MESANLNTMPQRNENLLFLVNVVDAIVVLLVVAVVVAGAALVL